MFCAAYSSLKRADLRYCCCIQLSRCDLQGVPFSVSGTVDLLALFRCISCRFKFTTDVTDPSNMVSVAFLVPFTCLGTWQTRCDTFL